MKKVLMVACVPSMIGQFNMTNIEILQKLDCQVGVACDFRDRVVWNKERIYKFRKQLQEKKISFYQIDFTRNILKVSRHFRAYRQLKDLIQKEGYEIIHCHTPVAAAIARITAHQTGKKVIYTAHGFHFFTGAPLKNWMLYYPVEKFLSRWTDCLITINKEDYWRAKKNFHAKRTEYVPGVGIDLRKIAETKIDRKKKRRELGISEEAFLILSVGELSKRKNHKFILQVLCNLKNKNICYVICGQGTLENELKEFVSNYGLEKKVQFLGYRSDVLELYRSADLFVFPSLQEGLPVALMEAMASKVPCIASDIRGNRDLLGKEQKRYLISLDQRQLWKKSIQYCMEHPKEIVKIVEENQKRIYEFSMDKIMVKIERIYQDTVKN